MKIGLIGSKAIGLGAYRVLRDHADVTGIVTVDDTGDTRSRLGDLEDAGAVVARTRSDANRAIARLDADLIVVAGWYWMIEGVRERPFVGIHHSLLPAYRGGSPLVWALIRGERTVGTSLFTLTEGMDDGAVWGQAEVPVRDGYIGDVTEACNRAALDLLPRLFVESAPTDQDHGRASWCAQRRPEDGLIDWTQPAHAVVRFIRAQSHPYPGAFTYAGEERITIWRASLSDKPYMGSPGQVVGNLVICGDDRAVVVEDSSTRIHGRLGGYELVYGRVS